MIKKYKFKAGNIMLAAAFIICIAGVLGGCFGVNNKDREIVQENKELNKFDKISIDMDTGNTKILKGDKYAIEAEYDDKVEKLTYEVRSNKLVVKGKGKNNWVNFINLIGNKSMEVKIYVPEDKINEVDIGVGSGSAELDSIGANKLDIDCGSGDIELKNADYDKVDVETGSGSFKVDKIKCNEMELESGSGDISCNSLNTNKLDIEASSSSIKLEGELKGKNTIETSSGDINIKTSLKQQDYSYDIESNSGRIAIDGESMKDEYKKDIAGASNSFDIKCSSGDINIKF